MLGAKDDLYSLRNNTNPTPSRTMTISSRLRDTPTPNLHTPSSKIVVIADDGLQQTHSKGEKTSPSYTTPPSSRLRATSNNAPTPHSTPIHLGSNSTNSPLSSPILTSATNNNLPHSSPKLTSSSDPNDPNAPPSPYESKSFKLNRRSPPRSRSKRLTTTPTRLKTTSSPVKTSHTSDHTTPTHPTTTRATRQVSSAPRLKSSSAPVFSAAFTSPKLSSQPNPDAPPSPYENKSFRLRGMDSPPRNSRNSRRTPPHTISSVPRLRVSPYKNNSFKLKHTSSGGQSQSAERSKRSFSSRSLFGSSTSSKTNSVEKTKTKQNVFNGLNGLNLNDDSDKDESSFSLYSLSSRSISPPPMTFGLETTTPRKVEIPFFDPKFAGSTRKERAKKEDAFAKFEAIFAGTERSPTKTLKKSNSKKSTSTSTSSSTSASPFSSTTTTTTSSSSTTTLKIKRKLKPKVKVSFETLGNTRRVSTVTGHVRNTSIGTTSMRSPRVSQRPPRPPQTNTTSSSLPPPPSIPTANANGVMFFKTGIMAYELLDAAENLVETKNTMTVTGRTAMKRVFPETKNGLKIEVNGTNVALYRVNNTVYAIGTECPHRKGPLHLGDIEDVEKHGMCVVCPWHRWTFRLTDGLLVKPDRGSGKDTPKSVVFPVELDLDTDEISVGFEEFGDNLFNGDIDF